MITYTQVHDDNSVVVPIRLSRETYQKLERLADACAKRQGTPVEEDDIPDLCEQAIEHALSQLHPEYNL